jgi:hypothetical protein
MQTIQISERTGTDGTLSLRVPLGRPDTEFDVVVIVHPRAAANGSAPRPATSDWRSTADSIREQLRATGRAFSDSTELIREYRDR